MSVLEAETLDRLLGEGPTPFAEEQAGIAVAKASAFRGAARTQPAAWMDGYAHAWTLANRAMAEALRRTANQLREQGDARGAAAMGAVASVAEQAAGVDS